MAAIPVIIGSKRSSSSSDFRAEEGADCFDYKRVREIETQCMPLYC